MEKVFCPNCGHQTLRKVPYMLDERTGQPVLLANRVSRPVSARGTKFSLPLPKGGRQEQKLILREDELLEQTRRRKKKNKDGDDIFDEDQSYLQPRPQSQAKYVVGKLRKNPNESRHRTGKRKKNSGALN
jgi:RNA-binding protein NOB1